MKTQPSQRGRTLAIELITWVPIMILVFGAAAGLFFQWEAIAFRYPLDYGEAPLVNQAMQLNAGQPIYRQSVGEAPFTIANYPPIYVGLLAFFEGIFGPAFWYGRLISTLSALGSTVIIFFITYSRSHNYKLSLIPALLFFNLPYVLGWSVLARIDHLALFLALTGLYLLFRETGSNRGQKISLILGAIFLVLAIYTRQSYALAAPFAGFLYLLQKDWRRAVTLTGLVGGMTLALFLLINLLTEGGFYFNIVKANINPFGLERVLHHFRDFFAMAPFLFLAAVLGIVLSFQRISGWPMLMGFALGGFFSALTIGKIGSNINYFLEFSAGLCLLAGFGLSVLHQGVRNPWLAIFYCLILAGTAWQGVVFTQKVDADTRQTLDTRLLAFEDLQTLEALVADHLDLPILADEYMGLVTLNDKDLFLQPFEITQLANGGLFDQQILIEKIEQEQFSLILLQEDSWWIYALQERWTPEMLEAIRANYRLVGQYEGTYAYKPRSSPRATGQGSCPKGAWPLPTSAYMGYKYENGWLQLYGAGQEGMVPVRTTAPGEAYRLENYPEGSLIVVQDDPMRKGDKVILYYKEMLSSRNGAALIPEQIPQGTAGIRLETGEIIGYQSMWAGRVYRQDWLHVTLGIAPYDPQILENPDLIDANLIHPGNYFGIQINAAEGHLLPIRCVD